jgi:hypothetical protein
MRQNLACVRVPKENPNNRIKSNVVLDDQSNRSLAKSSFFDFYEIHSQAEEFIMNVKLIRTRAMGKF